MDLVKQLNHIFFPRSVAIIGASNNPDKTGFLCVRSLLISGFKGKIYPVNPDLSEVSGLKVYPSIGAIPDEVDLAVIAIPAQLTLAAIEECVAKGVKGAVMFTSGYKELGTEMGLDLQDKIRDVANKGGMKIIGPNCLGILNPYANLNATFDPSFNIVKTGNVAIASQSGGVSLYIANALSHENVGVSKVVSMGNRCNLDFDEIVTYFAEDEKTRVIVLYIEGLENPRRFIRAAREVVKRKPIVVYKVGRTGELNQASLSHTGAMTGKYQFYLAAFRQAGIIAVDDITELVDIAKVLAFQPPSPGNRVAVLSGPAGAGIIMADKCYELGLRLAEFSPATKRKLRQHVSPLNPIDNPVDLAWALSDADASREILRVVMEDDNVDMIAIGVWRIDSPQVLIFNEVVLDVYRQLRKPIVYAGVDSHESKGKAEISRLEQGNIPVYPFPERAVTGLAALYRYGRILKAAE